MVAPDEGGGSVSLLPSPPPAPISAAPRYYVPPGAAAVVTPSLPAVQAIVQDTKRIQAGGIGSGFWTGPLMLAAYVGVLVFIIKGK